MANTAFSDNFRDLSTDVGFQFELYCERCHDAYRPDFEYHTLGVAAKLLRVLSSFTGGILHSIGWRSGEIAEIGLSQARDAAFCRSIASAKDHFHRCARCGNYASLVEKRACPECKAPIEKGARFCPECAQAVRT